jgi:hypothetical protein
MSCLGEWIPRVVAPEVTHVVEGLNCESVAVGSGHEGDVKSE